MAGTEIAIFDDLLVRGGSLEAQARAIQGVRDLQLSEAEIEGFSQAYEGWWIAARAALSEDLAKRFDDEFRGGVFSPKIRQFLEEPGRPSPFFPEDENPLGLSYWAYAYESTFRVPFQEQKRILLEARQRLLSEGVAKPDLELVERVCERLPEFLAVMQDRGRDRPPIEIADEYDLQDVLHGLLRVYFEDVRTEDYAPERSGGRSRIDFVLRGEGILVEAKFARPGHGVKRIAEELIDDMERYRSHPDAEALVALVYDPGRVIVNSKALQRDLGGVRDGLRVAVIVTR